jgi:UDP-glucose 4-epimerase
MRALVTGGAGFIGSNLVDKLVEDGHEVDMVDDLSNGKLIFLSNKIKDESIIISDFADSVILEKIRRGSYNAVFHLAALPSVGYSVEHPAETNDVNVSSTIRLLDACNGNINRFIFASSSAVYGNVEKLPSSIDDKKNPNSP